MDCIDPKLPETAQAAYSDVQLFIDASWCAGSKGRTIPVLNPATGAEMFSQDGNACPTRISDYIGNRWTVVSELPSFAGGLFAPCHGSIEACVTPFRFAAPQPRQMRPLRLFAPNGDLLS